MKAIFKRTTIMLCAAVMAVPMVFSANAIAPNDTKPGQYYDYASISASSDYTLTIPASFDIKNSGWNEIGEIKAGGTLEEGKKLVVTATSENDWALKSGENEVSYEMMNYEDDSAPATLWEFTDLPASQSIGINVEDYKGMPAGNYTDTVTFTASVANAATVLTSDHLTWLDGNYIANEDVTIDKSITVAIDADLVINDGVTVTITEGMKIADGATLTINGQSEGTGKLIVTGADGISNMYDVNASPAIYGDGKMTVNGGFVTAIGGNGSVAYQYYTNGGNGGTAIMTDITVHGGTVTATGGNGGDGGFYNGGATSGGNGGDGISGNLIVDGGLVQAAGGNGGSKVYYTKSDGKTGKGVSGTLTAENISVQGSNDNITEAEASTDYNTYKYLKIGNES